MRINLCGVYALLIAVVLPLFSACRSGASTEDDASSIVVLFENDVHCAIDGYARMAGLRDAISDTAHVVVVSSGDFMQGAPAGALSKGRYIIDIMNSVGYDAVTLGNHEFDYKCRVLREQMERLTAPVTCVNLFDCSNDQQVYAGHVLKRVGNKTVAFVGVTTPTAMESEEYAFFDDDRRRLFDLRAADVYGLVQQAVDEAHDAGADYVIVLSHLGEAQNEMNVDSHGLVQNTNGIDVILDGHTHSAIPSDTIVDRDGRCVLISQTGTQFANVGKLLIMPDGSMTTQLVPIDSIDFVSERVAQTTDSVEHLLENQTKQVVCQSDVTLRILDDEGQQMVRFAETNAGDIVADAYRMVTGAEIALTNGGGIRTDLPAGTLTYGDIVTLLPFDNYVSVVEITGRQLYDLLTLCINEVPVPKGDFPQVSGLRFTVHTSTHTISDLLVIDSVSGEYTPVALDRTYRLATIDYCINGGGFDNMLRENKVVRANIIPYNECLIKYVSDILGGHIGTEYAEPQGRIKIVD